MHGWIKICLAQRYTYADTQDSFNSCDGLVVQAGTFCEVNVKVMLRVFFRNVKVKGYYAIQFASQYG